MTPSKRTPPPSVPAARALRAPAPHRRRGGVALVTALGVLLIIGILVAGTLVTTQVELGITRNDATATQAQYAAEAGLQAAKAMLFQYYRWIEDYYEPDDSVGRAACFSRLGEGVDLDRNGTVELRWSSNRLTLIDDGTVTSAAGDRIGSHDVLLLRDSSGRDIYTIESRGTSNGARATVRSTVLLDNTGVLEQALFTGVGQANKHLNGGATVRGGVYVVGDENFPNTSVIDANGNFAMYNDYDLTSGYGGIGTRVTSENRKADNLCATLRVQHGEVSFSGSVQLGDPSNDLLGVFVGDEESDLNNGIGECSSSKGICSDDVGIFDIDQAEAPDFPRLDSPPNPDLCYLATWRACIDADGDANGITADFGGVGAVTPIQALVAAMGTKAANLTDAASCAGGFSYQSAAQPGSGSALARGGAIVGASVLAAHAPALAELFVGSGLLTAHHRANHNGTSSSSGGGGGSSGSAGWTLTLDRDIDCTATIFYNGNPVTVGFEFDVSNGKLEVFGTVNLKGIDLVSPGEVEYFAQTQTSLSNRKQMASLVVQSSGGAGGNIALNGSLLTGTSGGFNGFPDHVLALIAEQNLNAYGPYTMAPMYAGQSFRTIKDRVIVGSVVSNDFCTTSAGSGACNAGQKAEIIYVNTGNNKPPLLRDPTSAGTPLFQVLSYEVR